MDSTLELHLGLQRSARMSDVTRCSATLGLCERSHRIVVRVDICFQFFRLKKMDAWVQKELRDSQYRGCTVAYKEKNVYNIYMKPRGNKIDAMPLSEDSDNRSPGGCRPGPTP